jgi:hypothetical protein
MPDEERNRSISAEKKLTRHASEDKTPTSNAGFRQKIKTSPELGRFSRARRMRDMRDGTNLSYEAVKRGEEKHS